jgi:hypothetical protein
VPRIQPEVERLTVFQRTPPWILPHPGRPVRPASAACSGSSRPFSGRFAAPSTGVARPSSWASNGTGSAGRRGGPEAQAAFNATVQRRMRGTVWVDGGCASWYIDAHGRNTTLWPGTSWSFRQALRRFDPAEHLLEKAAQETPQTLKP